MGSIDEGLLPNMDAGGPTLEDFLATDPSQLPFLQESPATAEDSVRYKIFADDWGSIEQLQQLRESVLQLVNSLTTGFIWHRDPFGLSVAVPSEEGVEPHLHGEQLFGGNVSDEWFVCYLLSAITSSFSRLTACVSDNDGEFLLIEAATAIPPFLSPANSDHRVWTRSGEVHLVMPGCMIDRARLPRTLGSGSITLHEGLQAVRESEGDTTADQRVQGLIRRRIEGYPEKAKEHMHHARCFLPVAAALALRDTPGLVAAAVRAFCSGDPTDKKLGSRMNRLLPRATAAQKPSAAESSNASSPPVVARFVEARITFTRHLYAQLHQAALVPSKAFPPGWGPAASTLSPAAYVKAAELGQKLSMGLEAAYQKLSAALCQACAEGCSRRANGDLRSAVSRETWKKFMDGLERNGFFEGELEGSKRYREKAAMAEEFVRESVLHVDDGGNDEDASAQRELRPCTVHEVVDRAVENAGDAVFLPSSQEDDEENWLQVSQVDLDGMLQDYGRAGTDLEAESEDRSDEDLDEGLGSDEDSEARHADFKSAAAPETDEETVNGDSGAQARQIGFETAVGELDDIVTGMNAFVDDSRAGMDGAEVEAVGGDVQFDVDKFMSLLSGEDLMSALDGASQEDTGYDDLHDSDEGLLESSDEESDEDDADDVPRRMPEPDVSKRSHLGDTKPMLVVDVRSESTPTAPASIESSRKSPSNRNVLIEDDDSYVRTRDGMRPTVAFQMREMEARPPEDEDSTAVREEKDGAVKGKGDDKPVAPALQEYVAAMEAELDASSLGQSFEKVEGTISQTQMEGLRSLGPLDQNEEVAPGNWLPDEGSKTSTGGEDADPTATAEADDAAAAAQDFKPVDVDMNLVKHLLESTASQGGLSGPASNLLRSMGLNFPSVPPGSGREPTEIEEL